MSNHDPELIVDGNYLFPSRFGIGQRVEFRVSGGENDGVALAAYVRAITFTSGKVRYSLLVAGWDGGPDSEPVADGIGTTIHNVDSCCVCEAPGEPEFIEIGFDNYS